MQLERVTTADGLRLEGLFLAPSNKASEAPVDAALLLHGAGGNFYAPAPYDALVDQLLDRGVAVLRANTRGHDILSGSGGGRTPQGAAFESVDACRKDIAAWCERLAELGNDRVALVGHSLGALKAVYGAVEDKPASVTRLVAISPPLLSYARFKESDRAEAFLATVARAEAHLAEARGHELLQVTFPIPLYITAASYIDKYGPAERYNLLRLVPRLTTPTLFTFGRLELDGNPAFTGLPEQVREHVDSDQFTVDVVEGANHFYSDAYNGLREAVVAWLFEN